MLPGGILESGSVHKLSGILVGVKPKNLGMKGTPWLRRDL